MDLLLTGPFLKINNNLYLSPFSSTQEPSASVSVFVGAWPHYLEVSKSFVDY